MTRLLALLILAPAFSFGQVSTVLFLGNSYTGTNNLPGTFYNLALAAGDTVEYDSYTPGGYTLEGHSTNATTLSKIAQQDWDFVVLQEQSQRPSFPPFQVESEVYPFAEILVDSIRSNDECTEPVFYMTWGRRAGDQQNCQFYPPLCTYAGMQQRLRESYLEMAIDNDSRVAPCGAAWSKTEAVDTTFFNGLYTGDGSHPSARGQYLNACVFYATLFHKSPVGIPFYSSIGQADAETLQTIAEVVVMDSLENWNSFVNFPQNNIEWEVNGLEVTFTNFSTNVDFGEWSLGDGTILTDWSPSHTYSSEGIYTATYISGNGCGEFDTTSIELNLTSMGFEDNEVLVSNIKNLGEGIYELSFDSRFDGIIEARDLTGSLILKESTQSLSFVISLNSAPQGVYLLNLIAKNGWQKSIKLTR